MSRDPRDWQKDMERVESFKFAQTLCNGIQPMFHGQFKMPEPIEVALEYWLGQVKQLKEDNARWTCQWNGAEKKYLTQSNVIAELRGKVERLEKRNYALMNATQERVEGNTLSLLGADREDTTNE